ncbi:hypothetical protein MADP07_00216 [Mycoplasma anatis]|uniref:ABC transporter ATP-binding protein n=1 Tax=Mycoplasmopsis anatis TaxID=171279 RepID=A0A9Q3LA01_9BACT|nr:hypothetical protein [Mycoplasmopsis anatis]MBW0596123.1 hypothetical protein [Mycoplasmopsis anatis]MBW0596807.1 hypothetical protein [Mycoplasmopsis anatis]MBW0597758.1 hypothetical protein [Mycoplasmopsis anatis]MBW0599567.1 hypothetical protein [Mycoplasmopsis anatis]MBW0600481.1 hypothetical protein [Mycoplasmopsis anatis]
MQKNLKKIFEVENFFIHVLENGVANNVCIPYLPIYYRERSAILINPKESTFWNSKFWDRFKSNPYTTFLNTSHDVKSLTEEIEYRNKQIFSKVEFFDLDELEIRDTEIPIYDIWNMGFKNINIDPNEFRTFEEITKKYEIQFKSQIFRILHFYLEKIVPENQNFSRELSNYAKKIKNDWFLMNETDFSNTILNINELLEEHKRDSLEFYFKLYQEIFNVYNQLIEREKSPDSIAESEQIKNVEIRLKYINDINNSSIKKVENNFIIRDINLEIDFYKKLLKNTKNNNIKYMNYLQYKLQKSILIIKEKMSYVTELSIENLDLYKELLMTKKLYWIWAKNKYSLCYLEKNKITEIFSDLILQSKMFINNTLNSLNKPGRKWTKLKIKKAIKQQFYYSFVNYSNTSVENKHEIVKIIESKKEKIKNLNKIKFEKVPDFNKIVEQNKFDAWIKLNQAEDRWNKYSSNKLFQTTLKNFQRKIKRFIYSNNEVIRHQITNLAIINESIKKRQNSNSRRNEFNDNYELIRNVENIKKYEKNETIGEFANSIFAFIMNKNQTINQFSRTFLIIKKIIDSMSYISVNFGEYLTAYDKLKVISKIKLKLLKLVLNNPSVLFIKDTFDKNNNETRFEFIRVLNKISNEYSLSYVLVTADVKLVKKICDTVHIFCRNTLVESGEVQELINNSKHPYSKHALSETDLNFIKDHNDDYSWIYSEVYEIDKDKKHYLYANFENYQKWTSWNNIETLKVKSNLDKVSGITFESEEIDQFYKIQNENLEISMTSYDPVNKKVISKSNLFNMDYTNLKLWKQASNTEIDSVNKTNHFIDEDIE